MGAEAGRWTAARPVSAWMLCVLRGRLWRAASGERRAVTASGDGAIAAGGTVGSATTRIVLPTQPAPDGSGSVRPAGVVASGKGAIAAGGDVHEARTEVHVSDGTLDS